MADHQRIHPLHEPVPATQPEPPYKATAPLVNRGSSRSENGDPERQQYQYPPHLHHTKPPKKPRSCFKKCFCWTIALILLQLILLGILAAIIYFVFRPKIPNYSVNSMRVSQFNYTATDNTLSATFNVNLTARNPNTRIGIYYESGSHLSVWYLTTRLCEGSLPRFYQGHRNTTVLSLQLAGQSQDGSGLLTSLRTQQQTGSIPLTIRGRVPVRLRLGSLRLMRWRFLVRCSVLVDSLAQDNVVRIRNSRCRFSFRL